jgi:MoaA/NifB/PqqE/SkfB family radical SAM enzyme
MSGKVQIISQRLGSNSWARDPNLIAAWRDGYSLKVPPATAEYSPTLVCNLGCPECPFRDQRHDVGYGRIRVGDFATPDDLRTSTAETARRILEACAEGSVRAVLWTGGGEPTLLRPLAEMLRYSARLGMVNGLYTNGVLIGLCPGMAEELLDPAAALVFARVSVNAVSDGAIKKHWGAVPQAVRPQFEGLRRLLLTRARLWRQYAATGRPIPSIQVSTIIDRHNVEDLLLICETVADTFAEFRDQLLSDDVIVVRPLTLHGREEYSHQEHDEAVVRHILEVCGKEGSGRRRTEQAGLQLHLGFGLDRLESGEAGSYSELIAREYSQRDYSWANGVFLTVGPDGSVFPSTEYNCNAEWSLGNLRTQSVREIYQSPRRRQVLRLFYSCRWGPKLSQATARTARLDRIARALQAGEITDEDIEGVRRASTESIPMLLD